MRREQHQREDYGGESGEGGGARQDVGGYRPRGPGLSEREAEVVGLVGRGATNAEISRALYISEGTARNHISRILRKLGLRDRTQLAIYVVEHGWSERR